LWIIEGKAEAAAINYLRRHPDFAALFPVDPGLPRAEALAGLRRYNLPLYYHFTGAQKRDNYATSSFWLHLADAYHGGRVSFLYDYSLAPAPLYGGFGGQNSEDWLRWLDQRLREDPKIRTPLYRVYPGFLTHFAGEWASGGIGDRFPRNIWLTRAFSDCKHVTVTPNHPYDSFRLRIEPMAGRCIRVRIKGISPDDLVGVKLGALVADLKLADALHLGFADTNDRTRFNCAQISRERRPPPGQVGCLFEPVTGTLNSGEGAVTATRMWYASSLELGPGVEQEGRANLAAIDNYYILS
jgi:hypothetical protein